MRKQELVFNYSINTETIARDRRQNLETMNSQGIYDAVALCNILILDRNKVSNTIYIKDTLISFCYNFLMGLKKIEIDNNYKGLMVNLDDNYSFRYYIENDLLLIVYDDKVYKYEFKAFYQSLKKFWKKVSLDLVFFYPELKENIHFQTIQKELTSI